MEYHGYNLLDYHGNKNTHILGGMQFQSAVDYLIPLEMKVHKLAIAHQNQKDLLSNWN